MTQIAIAPRPLKINFIERTGMYAQLLRRYTTSFECPNANHAHMGRVAVGDIPIDITKEIIPPPPNRFLDDPRWPKACDFCGKTWEEIGVQSQHQVDLEPVMRDAGGVQRRLDEWYLIPGTMWDVWYHHDYAPWCGHDGKSLAAICPCGTYWLIDGPCNNCTLPEDKTHKCWPRGGTFPMIDVGKQYQPTCSAGAGSIDTKKWHGFLRNGYFVDC